VGRKLAYPHNYQTRSRGLDETRTDLVVTNEEQDSDTKASGSWAAPIPWYDNHEVGPGIDIWVEEKTLWLHYRRNGTAGSCSVGTRRVANARGSRCRDQIEAYGRQFDT
jgi:hypothetical protein